MVSLKKANWKRGNILKEKEGNYVLKRRDRKARERERENVKEEETRVY